MKVALLKMFSTVQKRIAGMTFEITPGTIYSAHFPFSDLSNKKKRPVLALSCKDENDDVRIAFITKTPVDEAQGFALGSSDFGGDPLKHQSHVRVDKTFNLHISRIEKPVARLSDKGFEHVLRRLVTLDIPKLAVLKYRDKPFNAGTSVIPPSGKVLGAPELKNMVEASLDGWLTTGRFNEAFEKRFAEFVGVPYALTTTSGSSANLLAFTALTSHKLGDRALKPGDEVITVAAAIRIHRKNNEIELQVRDEGRGLPQDMMSGGHIKGTNVGVGIAGMQERIKHLRG